MKKKILSPFCPHGGVLKTRHQEYFFFWKREDEMTAKSFFYAAEGDPSVNVQGEQRPPRWEAGTLQK
jgi:hypothetical protein